jgi:hypothetical protein
MGLKLYKMPPKKTKSEKKSTENIIFHEDETDTGTTTEANEPIEVDDDVSHGASKNKEISVPFGQFIHVVNIRQR